ncbi:S24 family peptidase [Sphingomonas montanisoli]|uniref:Helix-turn-helix transcriptional regulator n=1 Tax=Sphingomonas montanisoli TaxID=2606412 RepID=A0A5D9C0T6_9SPHN|nr:S24 family peptidase [Sphingomonas montanisoli]TZG24892.1 helix-turn-helix transcriptional regulator [Sphingomonas montanisoli]
MAESITVRRLKQAMEDAGLDQPALAAAAGCTQGAISQILLGKTARSRFLPDIAQVLGVSVDWLRGSTINRTPDLPAVKDASAGDDTVEVAQLDLSFSMGPGTTIDDYIEEVPYRFDIGWLRRLTRSEPRRLRLARGVGESMSPTLLTGDQVLIDTTQRQLNKQDGIYAISLFGAAAIKRLRAIGPQRVRVISDNPAVEDQDVDAEDISIAGRVIWFSREL